MLGMHPRTPKQLANAIGVHHVLHFLARGDLARQLARHRSDLPLQLSHATLASVARHYGHDRIFGEGDLLVAQARLLELAWEQVRLRYLGLFLLRISGEIDHFHSVEQRSGNILDEISSRDEQHLAQVERNAQVVVGEGVVLRRIQHLEQRAGWIALERRSQLVDFVEQEYRVLGAGLLHSLDDASRHRADVGTPVAADVRFISGATQGDTHVLAPQRAGDGLGDRCLADSRRADEEKDRSLRHGAGLRFGLVGDVAFLEPAGIENRRGLVFFRQQLGGGHLARLVDFFRQLQRAQLSHRQELQHAILHVLEPVVILVEHLRGVIQLELVVRSRVPRELGDPLEVRPDDLRFHRFAAGALEPAELALDFRARLLGQRQLREFLAKLDDLLARVVVAKLLLDRLQLLAQIHLALALAELFLDLRLDVFLRLEQADLALHVNENAPQTLFDAECLEQTLFLRNRQLDVTRHQIGKTTRVGDGVEDLVHDFLG